MTDTLFAALAERWLDPENDDPAEWTDEMLMKRIEDLVGEGWYVAGKESERAARLEKELRDVYLASVYTTDGVKIWIADAEKKGQSVSEQLVRAAQLATGAYV